MGGVFHDQIEIEAKDWGLGIGIDRWEGCMGEDRGGSDEKSWDSRYRQGTRASSSSGRVADYADLTNMKRAEWK